MTSLHLSATLGDKDTFKLLLERGADPDIKDDEGDTGRSLAAEDKAFDTILQ
jgi:ankyrin repeat protein